MRIELSTPTISEFLGWLSDYWAPHNRIARKLRWLERYSAEHDFTVAPDEFADLAKTFEDHRP